jgi:hypothetical protein
LVGLDIEGTTDGPRARVLALNSCIGCGERRYLPEAIRTELTQLLEDYAAEHCDELVFRLGEQLDTPLFLENDISILSEELRDLAEEVMPIVVAHHNLLPQALVKVAPYGELLNGGFFRTQLSSLDRPILYCHGHIHDDPIEVVGLPERHHSGIACISAPKFIRGFNVLEVTYGRAGFPLGCEVRPFRCRSNGIREAGATVRIPLHTRSAAETACDESMVGLLKCLSRDFVRFAAVLEQARDRADAPSSEECLAAVLHEAEWIGLVEILNRSDTCGMWQVRRSAP